MGNNIRVRFAPSPTGYLHVGGLRTALYNYLFAKKYNGSFILRIEDTDRNRYIEGAVDNLINTLKKMGICYEEGPFFQSERTDIYRQYASKLLDNDSAYRCFCSTDDLDKMREEQRKNNQEVRYDGRCRLLGSSNIDENIRQGKPYVIRAKIPQEGIVEFNDIVRGKISFRWDMVEDQVLMKSDNYPTYHLANVIDDHLMKINFVIRGEEWLTSTPKHIFLYNALDMTVPDFAHLPLLLNPDKSKLSKRQGDVAVEDFLEKGYLPEALINYVALLGWHSTEDREIFSLGELEQEFSLERINKAGAVFDQEKLYWMNGVYIRNLDTQDLAIRVKKYFHNITDIDETKYLKAISFAKERINLLPDITKETEMFFNDITYETEDLDFLKTEQSKQLLELWIEQLGKHSEVNENFINDLIKLSTEKLKIKGKYLYFPLRIALYGRQHGPNIPVIIDILGKEESINRLRKALYL